jgi:hypothetical protein
MNITHAGGVACGISAFAAVVIVNTPLVRSRLKSRISQVAAASLLTGLFAFAGMLLLRVR